MAQKWPKSDTLLARMELWRGFAVRLTVGLVGRDRPGIVRHRADVG